MGAPDGEHERQVATGAGFAQGKVAVLAVDELLFNDEGILTVTLLGFLRRDGMTGKVTTIGIIPIKKRCRRMLQMRVPALYLPPSIIKSQFRRAGTRHSRA